MFSTMLKTDALAHQQDAKDQDSGGEAQDWAKPSALRAHNTSRTRSQSDPFLRWSPVMLLQWRHKAGRRSLTETPLSARQQRETLLAPEYSKWFTKPATEDHFPLPAGERTSLKADVKYLSALDVCVERNHPCSCTPAHPSFAQHCSQRLCPEAGAAKEQIKAPG